MATRVTPFTPVMPNLRSQPHAPPHDSAERAPPPIPGMLSYDDEAPSPPPLPPAPSRVTEPDRSPERLDRALFGRGRGGSSASMDSPSSPGSTVERPNSADSANSAKSAKSAKSQTGDLSLQGHRQSSHTIHGDEDKGPLHHSPSLTSRASKPFGLQELAKLKGRASDFDGVGSQRHAVNHGTHFFFQRPTEEPCVKWLCGKIVENKYFVALTTILTIYALIGDDIRQLATDKPADDVFNILTIICFAVFFLEIAMSCLGKHDYFMGFFFSLDVISTMSLILDLTWVAESLLGDGEGADKLRSGRTARVGAKAGRVVRVIRLVRIIKLWKAIQDAKQERIRMEKMKAANAGDEENQDDWGDDNPDNSAKLDGKNIGESRVGRKLSEMTTRRVIILVLTMLLVLPFLQTDNSSLPPQSPWFAADNVYETFLEWNTTRSPEDHLRYERAVLKYMYFHNWFSGNVPGWVPDDAQGNTPMSPAGFQSHVFWLGIMSANADVIQNAAWVESATQLRLSTVQQWEQDVVINKSSDIYVYGGMPPSAQGIMASKWQPNCDSKSETFPYRLGFSLLKDKVPGQISYAVSCPEDLRFTEKGKYYPRATVDLAPWHFTFYFDLRPFTRQEAIFGLCVTVFICIVLCVASLFFSSDASRLVLRPVENMVKRVEMIRNDPLIAVKMADEEFKMEEKEKARLKGRKGKQMLNNCQEAFNCLGKGKAHEPMETVILEKTIIKLGSLLALGFGEAGANIIGHNLSCSDSAGVNAMIQGMRVEAIIGLARIRDFSTATEVLKAKVMTFVNQIAEIVHGVVSEFHGAANKNNGDTFLLIWRLSGLEDAAVSRMADMSTIAFAKIIGAIHRSPILANYRGHPALQQRLGGNCRVCVTLGLHAGWAIEGAVGSEFKIDASYLSPNVSIAVQVEQATNIYTVPILITEQVKDLCCLDIAVKFRMIDRVVIRGSAEPTRLFCLDLDYMCLTVETDTRGRPATWNSRHRFKARQFLEAEKSRKLDPEVTTLSMFEGNGMITQMRRRYSIEFLQLFNMGLQNYMEGEWQVAGRLLTETRRMLHVGGSFSAQTVEDGPSSALLKFMEKTQFEAPRTWMGVHDLLL